MDKEDTVLLLRSDADCLFCKRGPNRDERSYLHLYYKFLFFGAHYLCVLTSTFVQPDNTTRDNIFGFDYECIGRAYQNSIEIYCSFCHQKNASLICDDCEKPFHLPCGVENNCVVEMFGSYIARCYECFRKKCDGKGVLPDRLKKYFTCCLCGKDYSRDKGVAFRSDCCVRTNCHLNCLRMLAFAKGPNVSCPRCDDTDLFQKRITKLGVHIPNFVPTEEQLAADYIRYVN